MSADWVKSVGVDKTVRKYFDQWKFKGSYNDGAVLEFRAKCKESSPSRGVYTYYFFPDDYYYDDYLESLITGKYKRDINGRLESSRDHDKNYEFVKRYKIASGRNGGKYLSEYTKFTKNKYYTIFVGLRGAVPVSKTTGVGSYERVRDAMIGLTKVQFMNTDLAPWENRDFSEDD